MRPLRIAFIGQRGVPATFGGIEHHVEELGTRLAARGHHVTVFARTNYVREPVHEYRGMRVQNLPTVDTKHLDAIVHSALSTAWAMWEGVDILHYHAIGPAILSLLPRSASRAKVVVTVHGRDSERAKWGPGARAVLSTAEWLSARVPDATIVVSEDLKRHYAQTYRRRTFCITNGVVEHEPRPPSEIISRWGLGERSFVLFVGRLVPEKAPDMLIRAFRRLQTDQRLVIAGGSSFTDDYVREVERLSAVDDRVILAGYVYGEALAELYSNASLFVLPSSLEGLPLTLLEAASYGTPVLVSDIPPHLEVVRDSGPGRRVFRTGDEAGLVDALQIALDDPSGELAGAGPLREEVLAGHRWDDVVRSTEDVYQRIMRA